MQPVLHGLIQIQLLFKIREQFLHIVLVKLKEFFLINLMLFLFSKLNLLLHQLNSENSGPVLLFNAII